MAPRSSGFSLRRITPSAVLTQGILACNAWSRPVTPRPRFRRLTPAHDCATRERSPNAEGLSRTVWHDRRRYCGQCPPARVAA
jgi:hypothetical protein